MEGIEGIEGLEGLEGIEDHWTVEQRTIELLNYELLNFSTTINYKLCPSNSSKPFKLWTVN